MKHLFLKWVTILAICFYVSGCKDDMNGPDIPPNCTYSVSTTNLDIAAGGTTGNIQVTAGSSCMWTAVSNIPWTNIVSGQNGSGNGTVTYEVKSNDGAERSGTLTIAGYNINLIQEKNGCNFNLNPTQFNFDSNGGFGKIHVQTSSACAWKATTRTNWIQIRSGNGKGNGAVKYSVAENNSGSLRRGKITVEDEIFTVEQSEKTITYSISGNVGAEGVEMLFSGKNAPPSVHSDKQGKFKQFGFSNGEYEVRPGSPCFDFQPHLQKVVVSNDNARDVNFSSHKNLKADAGGTYFQFSDSPITLSALKSVSANQIRTYTWDFGDGTSRSCDCPTIQHTYSEDISPCPGSVCTRTLPIILTIRDVQGCIDVARTEIEITFGY
jgi:hypothetical protein